MSRAISFVALVTAAGLAMAGCAASLHSSTTTSSTARSTATTLAPWSLKLMGDTFVQATSVVVASDGTANVTALALRVICSPGTPDDVQFQIRRRHERPEIVHLVAGATLTGVNFTGGSTVLRLTALAHYLAQDTDGNLFEVIGPRNAARELLGRFHP